MCVANLKINMPISTSQVSRHRLLLTCLQFSCCRFVLSLSLHREGRSQTCNKKCTEERALPMSWTNTYPERALQSSPCDCLLLSPAPLPSPGWRQMCVLLLPDTRVDSVQTQAPSGWVLDAKCWLIWAQQMPDASSGSHLSLAKMLVQHSGIKAPEISLVSSIWAWPTS